MRHCVVMGSFKPSAVDDFTLGKSNFKINGKVDNIVRKGKKKGELEHHYFFSFSNNVFKSLPHESHCLVKGYSIKR